MTLILLPGETSSIALETSKGKPVENVQHATILPQDRHWDDVFAKKHLSAKPRAQMTGRYNCHGLTFGSRRTRIYSHLEVIKIIHDDGYKMIDMQNVIEGDFILYCEEGEYIHSGIVITRPSQEDMWNPLVLSKWGSGREYIHRANDCPYKYDVKYIRIDNQ